MICKNTYETILINSDFYERGGQICFSFLINTAEEERRGRRDSTTLIRERRFIFGA